MQTVRLMLFLSLWIILGASLSANEFAEETYYPDDIHKDRFLYSDNTELPLEMGFHIFSWLDVKDLITAERVCKNWCNLTRHFKMKQKFINERLPEKLLPLVGHFLTSQQIFMRFLYAQPSFKGIELLQDGFKSAATAISADGAIVAVNVECISSLRRMVACQYKTGDSLQPLLDFDKKEFSGIHAMDAQGIIFGGMLRNRPADRDLQVFLLNKDTPIELSPVIADYEITGIAAMNADGSRLGCLAYKDRSKNEVAVLWQKSDQINELKSIETYPYCSILAMDAKGDIIVGRISNHQQGKPVYWTADGAIHILPIPYRMEGYASCISPDGTCIGGGFIDFETGLCKGILWQFTPYGKCYEFIDDNPEETYSIKAISANGKRIVGSYWVHRNGKMVNRAFIYSQSKGLQNLQDILQNAGLLPKGWQLTSANAISWDGLTIAGDGFFNRSRQSWVITLPFGDIKIKSSFSFIGGIASYGKQMLKSAWQSFNFSTIYSIFE